jgi:hypothetical protein
MSFSKIIIPAALVAALAAIGYSQRDAIQAALQPRPAPAPSKTAAASAAAPLVPESFPTDLQEYAVGLFREAAKKRMDISEKLVAVSRVHNDLRKDREETAAELAKTKTEGDAMWDAFDKTPTSTTVFYKGKEHLREIFKAHIKLNLGTIKELEARTKSTAESIAIYAVGVTDAPASPSALANFFPKKLVLHFHQDAPLCAAIFVTVV